MISTKHIGYCYKGRPAIYYPDLTCNGGETLLVTGHSGCGKTTLMHILGGLINDHEGHVYINNTDLQTMKPGKRDVFRGQHIGIVFQHSHFIRSVTVRDNILLAAKRKSNTELIALAESLQIAHLLNYYPSRLSQGEQQRAAIARALINKPAVLLADEPTSSLDDGNAVAVTALLQQQCALYKSALIIVTHDYRLKQQITNSISLA